jgi:hypothetical protein
MLFVAFAFVNANDKDAWLWVSIYMIAAICCGLAIFRKYYPAIYLIVTSFYLIYSIVLFFAKDGVRDWIVKYNRESIIESMQARLFKMPRPISKLALANCLDKHFNRPFRLFCVYQFLHLVYPFATAYFHKLSSLLRVHPSLWLVSRRRITSYGCSA